ncbi:MAG: hypothetical protein H0U97_18885 [Gammaproteobacteria bacterium]|nr:hypothetical protein [Gammaproteobacteria bacterium]
MSQWFEDFKTYLPKYLPAEAQANLFAELSQFPNNIDRRLYTLRLLNEMNLFQGDGLASLWVADLPNERIGRTRVMILSNTCDIAPDNKRLLGPRILYCPIISFPKYQNLLNSEADLPVDFSLTDHLEAIRKQHNSSMFYLPKNEKLGEEGIAVLDRINNCDAQAVDLSELVKTRLFTLSDYGFYLFLYKLSLHLTRIREGIARN